MRLYKDGGRLEKIFDCANGMHATPSTDTLKLVSSKQFGAYVTVTYEQLESIPHSYVSGARVKRKKSKLVLGLDEIPDFHGLVCFVTICFSRQAELKHLKMD